MAGTRHVLSQVVLEQRITHGSVMHQNYVKEEPKKGPCRAKFHFILYRRGYYSQRDRLKGFGIRKAIQSEGD